MNPHVNIIYPITSNTVVTLKHNFAVYLLANIPTKPVMNMLGIKYNENNNVYYLLDIP